MKKETEKLLSLLDDVDNFAEDLRRLVMSGRSASVRATAEIEEARDLLSSATAKLEEV